MGKWKHDYNDEVGVARIIVREHNAIQFTMPFIRSKAEGWELIKNEFLRKGGDLEILKDRYPDYDGESSAYNAVLAQEVTPRKRKRLRGQMDWALQRLREMSDLKKEIHSSQSLPNQLLAACEATLDEIKLVYGEHAEKAREILHAAIARAKGEEK